jgi:hypothetical protein
VLPLSDAHRNLLTETLGLADQLAEYPTDALGARLEDALLQHIDRTLPLLVSRGYPQSWAMLLDQLLAPRALLGVPHLSAEGRWDVAQGQAEARDVLRSLLGA